MLFGSLFQKSRSAPARKLSRRSRPEVFAAEPLEQRLALSVNYTATSLNSDGSQFAYNILIGDAQDATGGRDWYMQQLSSGGALLADNPAFQNAYTLHLNGSSQCTTFFVSSGDRQTSSSAGNISPTGIGHYSYTLPSADPLAVSGSVSVGGGLSFSYSVDGLSYNRVSTTAALTITPNDTNAWSTAGFGTPTGSITTSGGVTKLDFYTTDTASPAAPLNLPQFGLFNGSYNYFSAAGNPQSFTVFPGQTFNQRLIVDLAPVGSSISINSPWQATLGNAAVDGPEVFYSSYTNPTSVGNVNLFATAINVEQSITSTSSFDIGGQTTNIKNRPTGFNTPTSTFNIDAAMQAPTYDIEMSGSLTSHASLAMSQAGSFTGNPAGPAGNLTLIGDYTDVQLLGSVNAAQQSYLLRAAGSADQYQFTTRSPATGVQAGTIAGSTIAITLGQPAGGKVDLRTDVSNLRFDSGVDSSNVPYAYTVNIEEANDLIVDAVGASSAPIRIRSGTSGTGNLTILGSAVRTVSDLDLAAAGTLTLSGSVSTGDGDIRLAAPTLSVGNTITAGGNRSVNLNSTTNATTISALVQAGGAVKESVRVATTAPITLSGTQTVDGVALVAGDRVLVKNQTTPSGNGIYVVVAAGAWTRATDANTSNLLVPGFTVAVIEGTQEGSWTFRNAANPTVGSTGMSFVPTTASVVFNPVRLASTATLTLSGVGQTIDGQTVAAGDRILAKNQTNPSENGLYVAAGGQWARASDADTKEELRSGAYTFVTAGTTNGGKGFGLTNDAVEVGTTPLTFQAFSVASPRTNVWSPANVLVSADVATTINVVLSGLQTIDGVLLTAGNRVLVKNQAKPAENGVYIAAVGAWSRATDADTAAELPGGTTLFVKSGTQNRNTGWNIDNSITETATTLSNSAVVSNLFSTAALSVGMLVVGAGIPANTTIAAINPDGHSIRLSANATLPGSNAPLSFLSTQAITLNTSPIRFLPVGGDVAVTSATDITGASRLQGSTAILTAGALPPNQAGVINALTNAGEVIAVAPGSITLDNAAPVQLTNVRTTVAGSITATSKGTLTATLVSAIGQPGLPPVPGNVSLTSQFGDVVAGNVTSTLGDIALVASNANVLITTGTGTPATVSAQGGNVAATADFGQIQVDGNVQAQGPGSDVVFSSANGTIGFTALANVFATDQLLISVPQGTPTIASGAQFTAAALNYTAQFGGSTAPPPSLGTSYGTVTLNRTDTGNIDYTVSGALTVAGASTSNGSIAFTAGDLTISAPLAPGGTGNDVALTATASDLHINDTITSGRNLTLSAAQGSIIDLPNAKLTVPGVLTVNALNSTTLFTRAGSLAATLTASDAVLQVTEDDALDIAAAGIRSFSTILTLAGNLTQTGSIVSSSLAVTNTNGTVSLTNAGNDVSSLAINNVGRAVSFTDSNGFDIAPAGIQGSAIALIAAGSLTQSGAVAGTSLAVTNSAGPVVLTNPLNNVASLSIANAGRPASYADANGFDVAAAGIQGSIITLNAAGDVTQTGAITGTSLAVTNTFGSVSLTNAANDVSSLSIINPGRSVSFTDTNGFNVTGLTGGAVVLRAGGVLSQSAPITATSLSVFNNGSDIALATQVNNVGTFSASNGSGKVQFQNGVTPLLIAGITGGPVTLQAAGAVSETAPINAASLNMIGSGADINLVSQVNNVGSFTASNGSGAVMLQNGPNPLSIGAVTGGYVYFNSPGAVSQTAPITASTLTVGGTGANTIDLSTQVNQIGAFTGNNGSGAIKLQTGSNPLSVGALAGGYVYLQPAGPVSQTGAITASTLTVGGSGSAINLGTQANSIGTFNFNNGAGSVSIRDAVGDLVLGTASAGAVSVQAAGVLTQSTAISATSLAVTGTGAPILLHTQPNNVGSFSASNGVGQVLFQSGANPVSVGPITGGYVYLQAGGAVSQSGAITADTLTVGGVGSAIALTAAGNAIGTFNVANGYGPVALTDSSGGLTLGYVHTGDLSASTVGDLIVSQPVEAGSTTPPGVKGDGNISLTSTNANILINANLTALQDMVTLSAINGTITQAPATLIACETLVWYAQSAPSLNSTATVLGVNQTSAGDLYMPTPFPGIGPITIAASSTVNGSIYIKATDVVIAGAIIAGGSVSKVDIQATSGNVTFDTAGSVTNTSGSGGVLITAAGSIIDNHPTGNDVTALSATLTAGTGSVGTLSNPLETSINTLSASANAAGAAIAIANDKALTLQSISATGAGSTAAIQAAGAIGQSGAILASALTVTGNGSAITLNTQPNQIGTFSATNSSGSIAIKDTSADLVLGGISGGAVSVTQTSGLISQSAPIAATSLSVTGSGQAIVLDTQANSVGSFSATNGSGSVSIKDTVNGLALGVITAGAVSVVSTGTGAISQTGKITATSLNVTGNGAEIQLHTQANSVGTFSASNNGAGTILFQNGSSPLSVGTVSGGYVYLQVAGAVSQSGAISATTLTVGGSGQPIELGTQANSIGTFNVSNGAGAVSIKDATGDLLVGYAYTGPLNIAAAGKVSISQVIAAGNIGIVTPGSLYVGPAGSPAPLLKSSTLIDLTGVAGAITLANSGTISAPTVLTGGKTIDFGSIATATQLNQAIASVNAMPNSAGLAYQLTVTQSFVLTQTIIVSNAIVLQGATPGTTLYGSSSVVNGLYLTSAASGSTIKNLAFGYFNGGTAVTLNGAKNTTLTGLTLSNSTTGLYVTGDSTGTSVVSNTIVNNQYGMQLVNATNLTVGGLSSGSNTVSYSAKAAVFASGNCVGSKVLKTLMSHNTVDYDVSASRNLTIVK